LFLKNCLAIYFKSEVNLLYENSYKKSVLIDFDSVLEVEAAEQNEKD